MTEPQTREDYVYLAKLAEQAERFEGVYYRFSNSANSLATLYNCLYKAEIKGHAVVVL